MVRFGGSDWRCSSSNANPMGMINVLCTERSRSCSVRTALIVPTMFASLPDHLQPLPLDLTTTTGCGACDWYHIVTQEEEKSRDAWRKWLAIPEQRPERDWNVRRAAHRKESLMLDAKGVDHLNPIPAAASTLSTHILQTSPLLLSWMVISTPLHMRSPRTLLPAIRHDHGNLNPLRGVVPFYCMRPVKTSGDKQHAGGKAISRPSKGDGEPTSLGSGLGFRHHA